MTVPDAPTLLAQSFEGFQLAPLDYLAFIGYFICLLTIGVIAGRKKGGDSEDYFLAGRSLPWYVVGSSYIAANISSEQFIGMIGAAYVYGICVATPEWSCVIAFTFLIWLFIPFLMAAKVFTAPEFLEKRFNVGVRNSFALVTIFMNVVVIMGGVIYGGGLALHTLFGWDLWVAVVILSLVAGGISVYGGLKSVAWMDVLTIVVMVAGGLSVTVLGWSKLAEKEAVEGGFAARVVEGFRIMVDRNDTGPDDTDAWSRGMQNQVPNVMFDATEKTPYRRLSVVQPINHKFFPWIHWVFSFFYIGLWYLVINQFMVQRLFAAKNAYHARMGIIFASYMKLLLPFIVVVPGLIWFAYNADIINLDAWNDVTGEADKSYINMLQVMVPMGLRGLFLAALFGAIQSTVSAVLNSTSTVFTFDIYQRLFNREASERRLVVVGRVSSVVFLILAMFLAYLISLYKEGLFFFIQMFYSFFGPPFSAIFLLGALWKRINGRGALAAILVGILCAVGLKAYGEWLPASLGYQPWIYMTTFPIQALTSWIVSMVTCVAASLATEPPRPEQVTDDLTFNFRAMNIREGLGAHWWCNVAFWWFLSMIIMFIFIYIFGVKF